MSEEELNEKYIRNKISGICQDCIYLDKIVPIINKMLSEQYIEGLQQGHFDNQMDLIQLQQRIDKAKIEISALMSRYFYEEDFYIEDTDLDKLLQILDKGEPNNE